MLNWPPIFDFLRPPCTASPPSWLIGKNFDFLSCLFPPLPRLLHIIIVVSVLYWKDFLITLCAIHVCAGFVQRSLLFEMMLNLPQRSTLGPLEKKTLFKVY